MEEPRVQLVLHLERKLVKHRFFIFVIDSLILVIKPFVLEICLDTVLQLCVYFLAVVEPRYHSEKFGEIIAIFNVVVDAPIVVKDINENHHGIGED